MKNIKIILIVLLSLALISCKSYLFNKGLEKNEAYNPRIQLTKVENNTKEVVFLPMKHFAAKEFYNDVKSKIDSLKKIGFYFFYESVNASVEDETTLRKLRKINGMPISKPGLGYMYLIDSVYKFKLKRELIDQPKYKELGVDSLLGKRVDLSLKEIITVYESKYGEIKLEACDFESPVYEKTTCSNNKPERKIIDDLLLTQRNQKIVNEVLSHKQLKIAMIYGEEHFKEIKEALLSKGFELSN